jgi:hypothetical protein
MDVPPATCPGTHPGRLTAAAFRAVCPCVVYRQVAAWSAIHSTALVFFADLDESHACTATCLLLDGWGLMAHGAAEHPVVLRLDA